MNTNDLEPARYAAQLAETINAAQEDLPDDWWQEVLIELHDQLAANYLKINEDHRHTTNLEQAIIESKLSPINAKLQELESRMSRNDFMMSAIEAQLEDQMKALREELTADNEPESA